MIVLRTLPKISNALLSLLLSVDSNSRSSKTSVVPVILSQFVMIPNKFLSIAVLSFWIVFGGGGHDSSFQGFDFPFHFSYASFNFPHRCGDEDCFYIRL